MKDRVLDVLVATFPYGGNGGTSSEVPTVRDWLLQTALKAARDDRIGRFDVRNFSDTPITMTRNQSVSVARENGYDLLLMIDSDMAPDCEAAAGDPEAKPFWDTSFERLYKHFETGPLAICAPYCGCPPHELCHVFMWLNQETHHAQPDWQLRSIDRRHAEMLAGIQPVDAQPTGLILFDLRLFDHVKPPYFYYEYAGDGTCCPQCGVTTPGEQAYKASTEDVVTTRNIAMHLQKNLDYNALLCNWDAWAGHWKPKLSRKPRSPKIDSIERHYRNAVLEGHRSGEKLVLVDNPALAAGAPPKPTGAGKQAGEALAAADITAKLMRESLIAISRGYSDPAGLAKQACQLSGIPIEEVPRMSKAAHDLFASDPPHAAEEPELQPSANGDK